MVTKIQQAYDQDFYAWTSHNAELLRKKKFDEIDYEHLAEEIEDMGKSNKRELMNRFSILIAHLLKWQLQPIRRSKSWMLTIKRQRFEIADLLEESPSLKHQVALQYGHAYEKALIIASEQTGIDETQFPTVCQFSLEECLNPTFLPE